jgi:hypothetical protein
MAQLVAHRFAAVQIIAAYRSDGAADAAHGSSIAPLLSSNATRCPDIARLAIEHVDRSRLSAEQHGPVVTAKKSAELEIVIPRRTLEPRSHVTPDGCQASD